MNTPALVETGNAVATAGDMAAMAELARPEEQADAGRVPVLKLNYDQDSKYPLGVWVLGQQKDDDGNITDEGEQIEKIVVLAVNRRLHFFNKANPSKSVNTKLVALNEWPDDRDAFNAKVEELQAAGVQGDAKWQIITCAMALVNGELKDCVMRHTGTAKFALEEYLTTMVKWNDEASGQRFTVPYFTFVTILGESEKKKNGTTIYWVPSFERGAAMTSQQHQDFFTKKRQTAFDYFEMLNNSMESTPAAAPAASPDAGWQEPPAPPAGGTGDDVPFDTPGVDPAANAKPATVIETAAPAQPAQQTANAAPVGEVDMAPAEDEYDIEAAINAAVNE